MDVLLSIRPMYAEAILNGTKRYEFRRVRFARRGVRRAYLYATSSVRRIVGYFRVRDVFVDSAERLWQRCHENAGISAFEFFRYFEGCSQAVAIEVWNPKRLPQPIDPRAIIRDFRPPQSFRYLPTSWLDDELLSQLKQRL